MIWPTIPFKPYVPRCPVCNKYLPDRCTCNGPSIEEIRMTNQEKINEALAVPESALDTGVQHAPNFQQIPRRGAANPKLAAPYSTGRLTNSEPVEYVTTKHGVERRHRGVTIDLEAIPGAVLISGNWSGGTVESVAGSFHAQGLATAQLADAFTSLATELAAFYQRTDSPAGSNAGQFQLYLPLDKVRSVMTRGVSGSARQRRRQVRRWKAKGFTVKQFNPATSVTIER